VVETRGVARKLREQIHDYSGRLSPRFSLPMRRLVEEMLYGIQASQSVRLSEVGRSLEEAIERGRGRGVITPTLVSKKPGAVHIRYGS